MFHPLAIFPRIALAIPGLLLSGCIEQGQIRTLVIAPDGSADLIIANHPPLSDFRRRCGGPTGLRKRESFRMA